MGTENAIRNVGTGVQILRSNFALLATSRRVRYNRVSKSSSQRTVEDAGPYKYYFSITIEMEQMIIAIHRRGGPWSSR